MPSGMHDAWLRKLAADGKGGRSAELPAITRGKPFAVTIEFGGDLTGSIFASSLRIGPDADGAALADFTVAVGDFANGVTPVTLSLDAADTGLLPADADFDGLVWMVYDVLRTPAGGGADRFLGGEAACSGAVT